MKDSERPPGYWVETGRRDYPRFYVVSDLEEKDFYEIWDEWIKTWNLTEPTLFVKEEVGPGKGRIHTFQQFAAERRKQNQVTTSNGRMAR